MIGTEQDSERFTDPVFLGLTRPTMVCGVPQGYFAITLIATMLTFLWSHSFMGFAVFPVLLGAGYLICLRDVRQFDVLLTKARMRPCLNASHWRSRSYDPFR